MTGKVANLFEHGDETSGFTKHRNCLNDSLSRRFFHAVLLLVQHSVSCAACRTSLVDTNLEGLGRSRAHSSSRYSTVIFRGNEEEHKNLQDFRFGCGIRTYDFDMQVGGVSACAKLLCEIRYSLLLVMERSRTSSFTNIETMPYFSTELQGVVSQQMAVLHFLQV
jgi:hypothetical protein